MKIFASHNSDAETRRQSSSGGIFSILANNILQQGGVVYGATFSPEWNVVHARIDRIEDLHDLRGSKYVYSHVGNAYTQARQDLDAGTKVLFSGTPCQVAAMKRLAPDAPNLLLVEIVCHGAPEPAYWDKYLTELLKKNHRQRQEVASINFRDKSTGWKNYSFSITFSNGTRYSQLHDDNPYMQLFLHDYTLREACYRCPFKLPDGSKADITIGDFWGISQLAPEIDNDLGTTIVIAHTPQGVEAIQSLDQQCSFTLEQISQYNPALTTCVSEPSDKKQFLDDSKSLTIAKLYHRYASTPLILSFKIRVARLLQSLKKNH